MDKLSVFGKGRIQPVNYSETRFADHLWRVDANSHYNTKRLQLKHCFFSNTSTPNNEEPFIYCGLLRHDRQSPAFFISKELQALDCVLFKLHCNFKLNYNVLTM